MTYKQQVQDNLNGLEYSLEEDGLRGDIISQRKTWMKHYRAELKRLKTK